MFLFSKFILTVAGIFDVIITIYLVILIVHVILSWIPHNPDHWLFRFIGDITEPVLAKIRRFIPLFGGIDLSPMLLMLALYLIQGLVVSMLRGLAMAIR